MLVFEIFSINLPAIGEFAKNPASSELDAKRADLRVDILIFWVAGFESW